MRIQKGTDHITMHGNIYKVARTPVLVPEHPALGEFYFSKTSLVQEKNLKKKYLYLVYTTP